MRTITFTADDSVAEKLDAIERWQNRSRELILADAIAAYASHQNVPETPALDKEDPLIALVKRIHAKIPPEALDDVPTDLARNYKHYLYGHRKED